MSHFLRAVNIQLYQLRVNGENLLLSEFCCYYEKEKKDEAEKIYRLFIEKLETIEESDLPMIESQSKLPVLGKLSKKV